MKKITFLILALFGISQINAQVSAYVFAQSSGTYSEVTDGTVLATATANTIAGSMDSANYSVILPFSFAFNGVSYTECNVNSNGYITFGTTLPTTGLTTPISSTTAYSGAVSAWGRDINAIFDVGGRTGDIQWKAVGTAPNREFVLQFRNFRPIYSTSTTAAPYINFQIRLSETTNLVRVVYGDNGMAAGTPATSSTFQVGLRGATNADYNNRTNTTSVLFNASTPGTANGNTQAFSNVNATPGMPASGFTYTWTPASCLAPSGVTMSNITTTTATVSWTASGSAPANGYDYFISTANTAPTSATTPTGSVAAGVVTANLTALNPGTVYFVWVRSACSGSDQSAWSTIATFTTQCAPLATLPWTENFDALATGNNIFPPCWAFVNTTSNWSISTAPVAYSGANSLRRTWSTDGWAFTPLATLTAGTSYSFSYFMRTNDAVVGYDVTIGVGTEQTVAGMATTLGTLAAYQGPTWTKFTYQFTPTTSGNYSFGVRVVAPSAPNGINFDDFRLEVTPTCLEPTSLTNSAITSSSATVSWTASTTPPANGYEYFVSTTNTAPTAGTAATGSVGAGVLSANLTALSPATVYYVWVRSVCSGTDKSSWSLSTTFTTACTAITTLPWTENFDALATGNNIFPPCWAFVNTTSNWSISTTPVANSGANSLRRTWSTDGWAFTPLATLTAGTSYSFSYFMRTNDAVVGYDLTIGVGTAQTVAGMTTTLGTLTAYQGPTWTKFTYQFTPTTSGNYSFGVRVVAPSAPNGINFDDFRLEVTPSCLAPTGLTTSAITSSSATVSWTASTTPPANGYEYFVSTINTAPTAGTTATGSVGAGVLSANLTALSPATVYYVWVRSVCSGADKSAWSISTSFTTACVAITTLPWTENFDALATGTNIFPPCWAYVNTTSTWSISTTPVAYSGANSLRRTWSTDGWAFTPLAALTAGTSYSFSYFMRTNDAVVGYDLTIGVGTEQTVAGMTTTLGTLTGYQGPSWTKFTYQFTPTVSGNYSFGVRVVAPVAPNGINFDDFKLEVTPSCLEPTSLVSSAITSGGATVSWTASTTPPANGYEYFVSTTNTAPTAGTTATGSVGAGILTVNLTGLTSATQYYVWVRSVCSGTEKSSWSTATTFTTLCTTVTAFVQNFDGSLAIPTCWAKVGTTGTANVQASGTAPSAPNVLYIFSSSATNLAVVSMQPVSNAGAGTHHLRFKARANFTIGGKIEVGYLTNPTDASTFVMLDTFTTTSTTVYDSFTANFGTAPGANQVLAFRHTGVPANSVLIDDVIWEALPVCTPPTGLTASNITVDSATISWTASVTPPAQGYDFYITSTSETPTVGTLPTGNIAALSLDLSGLSASITYYFWIRSACSTTNASAWSVGSSFTTMCFSSVVPYVQDFESTLVPEMPACTSTQNVGTGNNWTVVDNPGFGFASKTLQYEFSSSNAANAWFYTNAISLTTGNTYYLTYKYGNNSISHVEKLKVAYGTTANNTGMTTVLADHDNITGGTTGSSATQNSIPFTVSVSGDYFFGFNAYSDANQLKLFVDDISVTASLSTTDFNANTLSVYPNPVKDVLNVNYSSTISQLLVYNLVGQEIYSKAVNSNESQMDVSSLKRGTYLVKVISEEGMTKTIKFIKE